MYNWSTNTKRLTKNRDKFAIFELEQAINFGLNGVKLSRQVLLTYWDRLNLDPAKKAYLSTILWPQS